MILRLFVFVEALDKVRAERPRLERPRLFSRKIVLQEDLVLHPPGLKYGNASQHGAILRTAASEEWRQGPSATRHVASISVVPVMPWVESSEQVDEMGSLIELGENHQLFARPQEPSAERHQASISAVPVMPWMESSEQVDEMGSLFELDDDHQLVVGPANTQDPNMPSKNLKSKPKGMGEQMWQAYQNAYKFLAPIRGGSGNVVATFAALGLGPDSCILKLAYILYVHENEDDYAYIPRGCGDWVGLLNGGAVRWYGHLSPPVMVSIAFVSFLNYLW